MFFGGSIFKHQFVADCKSLPVAFVFEILFKDDTIEVRNIILDHTIVCSGFVFREIKHKIKIKKEKLEKFEIPFDKIPELRKGRDVKLDNGKVIINSDVTKDPTAPFSYAYCTDTRFCSDIVKKISRYFKAKFLLH